MTPKANLFDAYTADPEGQPDIGLHVRGGLAAVFVGHTLICCVLTYNAPLLCTVCEVGAIR